MVFLGREPRQACRGGGRPGVRSPAKTLKQASIDYTPDNPAHIDSIIEETGFDRMRKISSLNPLAFEKYWKAIEKIEKWVVGKQELSFAHQV